MVARIDGRAAVRAALADIGAGAVDLGGTTGYVLADDIEQTDPVEPWAALLPPLDPTTMGWIDREWYLGSYKPQLVDSTGNAGASMWWDGRIVGGWRQRDNGEVELQPLEDAGREGRRALEREAGAADRVVPRETRAPEIPVATVEGDRGRVFLTVLVRPNVTRVLTRSASGSG